MPQPCPVLHRKADGIGHAQHGVGGRDIPALQRGADAGRGHRLFLKLCHGHHHYFYPKRGTEGAQQLRRTGSLCTKGEVFAAEQRPGVAVFHDAAHKLLRAQRLDRLKVRGKVILHPKAVDQGVLILGGE